MPVDVLKHSEEATGAGIEKIYRDHHELVYRTAHRITGNGNDAEDVLQTLFLRLIGAPSLPVVEQGWRAYLHRAAVNISLDVLRRRRAGSTTPLESWVQESGPDPYQLQRGRELGARLRDELRSMSPRVGEIFLLRHVEGYSNRDIARMLGTSAGSVAVTLFRARSRLRKSLRSFEEGGE